MARTKESAALDACNRVTLLGNKISVHMLDYLSSVKHYPEGLEQLTREFLDICRILFSIEAGLSDCASSGRRFPPDMVVELERKFRMTQTDFQELDRMIHKFLDYENKGTVGRIQKGFRRMFPDHDISRMRESLARSREALRMSALVFQWSLGDARIEDSVGIGYTGLAAALDRMSGNRSALGGSTSTNNLNRPHGSSGSSTAAAPAAASAAAPAASAAAAATSPTAPISGPITAANVNSGTNGGSATNGANGASLSRTRTADPPSPPPQHDLPPTRTQQVIKSSMLDVDLLPPVSNGSARANGANGANGNGSYATRSSSMMHGRGGAASTRQTSEDSTHGLSAMPPMLPAPQFLAERDSGKEINLSDELRLIPDLRRRPSTSNNTVASSLREAAITTVPTSTTTTTGSNPSRSRVTSTLGGSSLSHGTMGTAITTDSRLTATTLDSLSHAQSNGNGSSSNARGATVASLLSDRLEVMSISASTAADSDSHAHGLAAPTPIKVVRLKADPFAMPRWTPRNTVGAGAANLRTALVSAVQGANYTLVEQLLDRGVSPDGGLLHEAVLQRDLESMRLLLLFGADANGPDKTGVTPLLAAIEQSFAEGATLLLKYGADPNKDAANISKDKLESPLVAAFTAGKVGLSQLLLAYGGNPNHPVQRANTSSDSDSGADNTTTLLLGAIGRKKSRKLVDLLLAYGADPNAKDSHGTSPLFVSVQSSRPDVAAALLEHGADANLPGPKHCLWKAAYHPSCLPVLLSHGADMKRAPGVLELATSLNKLEAVRSLVTAGVDIDSKKDGVYTPLCTAIRDDHIDIFNFLLAHGANPNLPATEYPAWKCVTHNRVHLLPALVQAGADLHKPPGIAEMAVQVGNVDALVWLLEHGGVSPDERSARGHTPLTTALRENRPDLVQVLLDHGADAGARGEDWPLVLAVRHPALLEHLLPSVANPRAVRGVLERAVAADQLASVKLLLAAGVSVEDKTGGVFSPLTTAIREGHRPLVQFLLDEAGANPNSPGEHLPLVKAIRRGHQDDDGGAEVVAWLLAKGGDINKTYRGWNAVMQVLEDGNADLLRLLLSRGATVDLDVTDDDDRTVAQMAAARGWPEGSEILLAHAQK